jgi:hypothetical protein
MVRKVTSRPIPAAVLIAAFCLILPVHSQNAGKSDKQASKDLAIGQGAPDFSLADAAGKMRKLSEFRDKKAVALVFYPAMFRAGG